MSTSSFQETALRSPSDKHYLIFMITGNPGLAGYYTSFMSTLSTLLTHDPSIKCTLHTHQFNGFTDSKASPEADRNHPWTLQEQIDGTLSDLTSYPAPSPTESYDGIILMGHSVGCYVLLELLRQISDSKLSLPPVLAGILLFPTVTHIAKSPSGVKFTRLLKIPRFVERASWVAKGLVWPLGWGLTRWLVGVVARMPRDSAEVTTGFLRSRIGIWQALSMAKEEMEVITEDRWDADIWGIEKAEGRKPKLIFYFGENDHWVADHTRDELIAIRAQMPGEEESSKPKMIIDKDKIPHGFCINHSELVAEKVNVWVREIIDFRVQVNES